MPRSEPSPELVTISSTGIVLVILRESAGPCFGGGATTLSVDGETVKQSGAPRALQVLLTASARDVRGIPRARAFPLAHSIVMADLRAALAARCPVTAREIVSSVERRAIRPRAGEHVVHV